MDALKAEQLTGAKWRVLAIPFGGPFKGRDFDGEYFDARTDIKPRWFNVRPVIFHHGADPAAKAEDYGEQELDDEPQAEGWWSTVWLNRSARYWAEVDKLLRAGKMFGSSGSISHLVRKSTDGHIDVWPHIEQTLTPTPSNPFARITAAKALAGFDSAGIALDGDVLAQLDRLAADDLPPDLGLVPGDEAAMRLRAQVLGRLSALETRVKSI